MVTSYLHSAALVHLSLYGAVAHVSVEPGGSHASVPDNARDAAHAHLSCVEIREYRFPRLPSMVSREAC